jgi:hypothetical protein
LKAWDQVKKMMKNRFRRNLEYFDKRYIREDSPIRCIDLCVVGWIEHNVFEEEWTYDFIHTLDMVLTN